ncbi:hypothetical protein AAW01_04085 [Aurantiacibacter gangjinensis]|uniref:Uncharacterized protein n=1 Tax=Aurantiacibacter gangjinensis TaxID=502682 RepID=A0A0G9MRJ2_9SPHN|nr:hypothetical protein AAW01_04085 [Aurantiacibacter gangjinensis]
MGAVGQFFSAKALENHRLRKANQRDAYNAFLAALSLSAHAKAEDEIEAKRALAHAKSLIALYGSPIVLEKLATLFEQSDSLKGIIAQFRLTEVLGDMRKDVGSASGRGVQGNMFPVLFS